MNYIFSLLSDCIFQRTGNYGVNIGLRDSDGDGVFEKDDGTPFIYSNWEERDFATIAYEHPTTGTYETIYKLDKNGCGMMGGNSYSNKWLSLRCDLAWHCYACQVGMYKCIPI